MISSKTHTFLPTGRLIRPEDRRSVAPNAPHAVVIGAGFGGLAAAIRLSVRGYRVTVVDRLSQPGGRARVHRIDGYTFDAGPTLVTAPFLFEELWALCGEDLHTSVDLRPTEPFYRIRFDDGESFEYSGDLERMRAEISRISPRDLAGYDAFLEKSREIYEVGFERLGHTPFGRLTDMARVAPAMISLDSHLSVHQLVARYIRNEKLRQVLSFHPLLVGGNPYQTTSIYTLIAYLERRWGVWFPMGGTGKLVDGMVALLRRRGVRFLQDTHVSEVVIVDGSATGIRLEDGSVIDSDIVVSNADSAWMYRHMVPSQWRKRWTNHRIDNAAYSMSLFVWYFGTSHQYEDVAHHTIILGPRYRGLLNDIFKHQRLPDDFSLYLHRPTATDASMAPRGCDAFYVLAPVPHLDASVDWNQAQEHYRTRIERHLEATVLPRLRSRLTVSKCLNPIGFRDDYASLKGAAFGLQPQLLQSAYFRPHNQSEDIQNLYLVGAGTHPGAGLPGVLSTARVLDSIVPDP